MQPATPHNPFIGFLLREWLPGLAAAGLVLTSLYIGALPDYSVAEIEVLGLLFALFVVVRGLEKSRLIEWVAWKMEQTGRPALQLVLATFFLSMFITNDAALVLLVPLGLTLPLQNRGLLVILLALAANAGSALTPLGNPQNLFIYWYYHLAPLTFIRTIAPFSLPYLLFLSGCAYFLPLSGNGSKARATVQIQPVAWLYSLFFILLILTILHILPPFAPLAVLVYSLIFDRRALRIDYGLLLSFFFFFGLAENMKLLLATEIQHADHIFLFSALASQCISNVPAALLFAKFTSQWQALLWGTNVGGFGSLVGSLANLIAYRIYVRDATRQETGRFTLLFVVLGYLCFFLGVGLYTLSQHVIWG